MAEYARRIADDIEQLKTSVRDYYRRTHTVTIAADAPAPLWTLPSVFAKCYPDSAIASEMSDEARIISGLDDGSVQIGVLRRNITDDRYYCRKCGEEQLYFSVPPTHRLANKKAVTFSDIDGETMLLMNDIGYWHNVHSKWMPNSRFLIQNERDDFSTLVNTSSLPSFSTNLTIGRDEFPSNRLNIPITDTEASATYYAVCLRSEYERFKLFFAGIEKVKTQ